jgi:hypothetical protein
MLASAKCFSLIPLTGSDAGVKSAFKSNCAQVVVIRPMHELLLSGGKAFLPFRRLALLQVCLSYCLPRVITRVAIRMGRRD